MCCFGGASQSSQALLTLRPAHLIVHRVERDFAVGACSTSAYCPGRGSWLWLGGYRACPASLRVGAPVSPCLGTRGGRLLDSMCMVSAHPICLAGLHAVGWVAGSFREHFFCVGESRAGVRADRAGVLLWSARHDGFSAQQALLLLHGASERFCARFVRAPTF